MTRSEMLEKAEKQAGRAIGAQTVEYLVAVGRMVGVEKVNGWRTYTEEHLRVLVEHVRATSSRSRTFQRNRPKSEAALA